MPRLLTTLLAFLVSSSIFAAFTLNDLSGIRVQPGLNTSNFIFLLSKKTETKINYAKEKNQLSITFKNTQVPFPIENVTLKNANVSMFHAETLKDTRIIFYVKDDIKWHLQYLKDNQNGGKQLKLAIISLPKPSTEKQRLLQKQFAQTLLPSFEQFIQEAKKTKDSHTLFYPIGEIEKKNVEESLKPATFTVVIDAGHGGKDTGAIGKNGALEKNIVLSIAIKLADKINQHQPRFRAILTRNADRYVPLRSRLKLARKGDADLFIAIHADAYFHARAKGASVYALSERGATTEAARWLALKDNYSELGDVALNHLQDRSPLLRGVLIDLAQTATIRDSLRLGTRMLETLGKLSKLHYRKVAQAPFVVLKSPDIPSVLVETGFISNPGEERKLNNAYYQDQLAQALWLGIERYSQAGYQLSS